VPESVRFVPVDFETRKLGEQLRGAGFEEGARAFFLGWQNRLEQR
jgi:O-methyltransferase involved in polyketide biosynthesis